MSKYSIGAIVIFDKGGNRELSNKLCIILDHGQIAKHDYSIKMENGAEYGVKEKDVTLASLYIKEFKKRIKELKKKH